MLPFRTATRRPMTLAPTVGACFDNTDASSRFIGRRLFPYWRELSARRRVIGWRDGHANLARAGSESAVIAHFQTCSDRPIFATMPS